MTKPTNITILPELAAWFRSHTPEEAAKFEHNLTTAGTILDCIKWARIKGRDGELVETPLDGHQRLATCQRLGIPIPDDRWELIEYVTTIAEARKWMRDWQFGRRNWSPNEMAMQAAQEYEEEKLLSGTRTDLHGKKTDTAKAVGARYGKTDRWVLDAVAFSNAVNAIKDNVGVDFPEELVQDERPALTRDQVIAIAQAPADIQREALELVKKRNAAGVNNVLEKARRVIGGTTKAKAEHDRPALAKYDLATLIYYVDTWSIEMVKDYNPTTDARAMSYLSSHLAGALHKLIVLAEANGLAGDVLDAYVARRAAQESDGVPGDAATAEEPVAAPGAPAGQREALPVDALRRRVWVKVGCTAYTTPKEWKAKAAEIGIGVTTLQRFLDDDRGSKPNAKTLTALQAYAAGA